MVQLMLYFRRNWIIALVSSGDCGRDDSQLLSDRPAGGDTCIAFRETLPMPQPNQAVTQWERRRLKAIVDEQQRQSSARVVVLLSPELVLHNFFREVLRQNLTGVVRIASESWAIDPVLHDRPTRCTASWAAPRPAAPGRLSLAGEAPPTESRGHTRRRRHSPEWLPWRPLPCSSVPLSGRVLGKLAGEARGRTLSPDT